MFSIIIPTFNNIEYLKICLNSLKKNSILKNEIILHINDGSDGTLDYAKKNNILHTSSVENIGLCTAINTAVKKSSTDLILYAHDDMYFCPDWDKVLSNEVKLIKHNLFYLSGTMIECDSAHITFNCGKSFQDFDERKLLNNHKVLEFYDHQGSHFAPHLVHKNLWNKVGGFSEEFNPGMCSDPDFNMKLWKEGVRIFKGIDKFRVYHFASVTTRKKGLKKNKGDLTFLKKWKITTKFFKKYFLRSNTKYTGPLSEPDKTIFYHLELFVCFLKRIKLKD
jgi:glycosyltransferase involved in cell wall biosynthesis